MKPLISTLLLGVQFVLNAQVPVHDHVVVLIFENKTYDNVIGSVGSSAYIRAPYINGLLSDTHTALFVQSYALSHTSQPNYLQLFSGDIQGVSDNSLPSGLPFSTSNLGASLLASGKTFIGYSEDLPYEGYNDNSFDQVGKWVRKHCPWINWQGSTTNGIPNTSSKPYSSFPTVGNFNTLPTISFVVPNLDNDMHDPTGDWSAAVTVGNNWLQSNFDSYIQWAKTNNSLLIITFDEDNDDPDNHIPTIFIGENVLGGLYSETITHHHVLRTIEDMFGLPYAGNSANVSPITDVWITPLPIELLSFKASPGLEGVSLRWSTASELNNEYFTIENSSNGIDFNAVATVKGAGTTSEERHYSFLDKNPFYGKSYYRLKQTDFDLRHTYSDIIAVDWQTKNEPSMSVYPNPADRSSFQIAIRNFGTGTIFLSMQDALGSIVVSQAVMLEEQKDHVISFTDPVGLLPGIYWLTISGHGAFVGQKVIIR